jgi:hypothetical protein
MGIGACISRGGRVVHAAKVDDLAARMGFDSVELLK